VGRALKPWLTGVALFALACAPPWVGLYGGRGIGDMYLFRLYAHRMERGLWPYHGFFFDWPPGTVPPVLGPAVLPGPYYVGFHVLAFLYGALALWALAATLALAGARTSRLYAATAAAAIVPFALGSITIDSTDLWPAVFLGCGLAALVADRNRLGLGLIGFAIVAKVYAVVVLPLALLRIWRRNGRDEALRSLAVAVAVVVVVSLPFLVVGPTGLGFTIKSQLVRGLQMESLGASILMTLDHLGLYHAHVVVGQPYSLDVAGGVAKAVGVLSTLLTVAAILWVYDRYRRGGDDVQRFLTACVAAVCAYVVFNKVLSPQYIVWLIPLVPLVAGTAGVVATALLVAAAGITETWFPGRFWHLAAVSPVSWFVLLRNLLLVGVFVAVARSMLETGREAADDVHVQRRRAGAVDGDPAAGDDR
jgi:uncharacterized membrane protein